MQLFQLLYVALIVIGFGCRLAAEFGVTNAGKAAWMCWFGASIVWGLDRLGAG